MMEPIPLVPMQASGHEVMAGASPAAFNVVIDAAGAVRRRPGIKAHAPAYTGVVDANGLDAVYVTQDGGLYAVGANVSGRPIYRVGTAAPAAFSGGAAELMGASRPTIAETEALLVLAAGSYVQKVELAAQNSARLGGTPSQGTHVIAQSGRLLVTDNSLPGNVNFSCVATGTTFTGHETWNGLGDGLSTSGLFKAVARPDPVVALHENTNDVFVFGGTSLQVWSPDDSAVYVPAATREYGCAAPYSVIKDDDSFVWLDHRRRFVRSDGRQYDDQMGAPIKRTMDEMALVSDGFGYRVNVGAVDAMVETFPTDSRTFVYQKGAGWSQWAGWDSATNNFKRFMVNCHCQRQDTGANVVGTTTGYIGELSTDTYTDLGERIVARIDTGFINRKTDKRKFCRGVYLSMRRATPGAANEVVGRLSWRDDEGPWVNYVDIEMDGQNVYPIFSLGHYRRRQWRIEFSGTTELVLVSAQEDFETLGD